MLGALRKMLDSYSCNAISRLLFLSAFAVIFSVNSVPSFADTKQYRAQLADALAKQDAEAIKNAVALINDRLGKKQGVPETRDQYTPIPRAATTLSKAEAMGSMTKFAAHITKHRWWHIGLDPAKLSRPLREPASAIVGLLAFSRAMQSMQIANNPKPTKAPDVYLDAARQAGDFLLWTQAEAGAGLFPFPAFRGNADSAPFRSLKGYLAKAEANNLIGVVKNGWVIEDEGNGGLQFDNGEAGIAIFQLHEATQDKKYLDAAVRSAEWAMRRPLVTNWNYNSFSVRLLARAYLVTGNQSYLDSATHKAMLGVIPGQLTRGENIGRWSDPHNARPAYHYIMMESLVELAAARRRAKADKSRISDVITHALRLGLIARNQDFLPSGKGAPTKEGAMVALLNVNRVFAEDAEFLRATHSRAALDVLTKLVAEQYRRGNIPLAPGAWGLMVERVLQR